MGDPSYATKSGRPMVPLLTLPGDPDRLQLRWMLKRPITSERASGARVFSSASSHFVLAALKMIRIKLHTPRTLPTQDAAAQLLLCG